MLCSVSPVLGGIRIQFIRSSEPTSKFLRTLLTTTPSPSHISDFRKQRRSDSRADKPDTFPGFDLQDEPEQTTLSPRKRRRQAYSQLIRGLLEKTRDRLHAIGDAIKDEKQLKLMLKSKRLNSTRPSDASPADRDRIALFEFTDPNENAEYAFTIGEFIDEAGIAGNNRPNATPTLFERYVKRFRAAVGLPAAAPVEAMSASERQVAQSSFIATYLLNPLINIWYKTLENFNLQLKGGVGADSERNNENVTPNGDDDDGIFSFGLADGSGGGAAPGAEWESSAGDSVTTGDDSTKMIESSAAAAIPANDNRHLKRHAKRSAPPPMQHNSAAERAAIAFRNAFLRHSRNKPTSAKPTSRTGIRSDGDNPAVLAQLIDDDVSPNIQIVPMAKQKLHATDGNDTRSDASDGADGGDDEDKQSAQSTDNVGILLLEIFGTVIGLTWGAFSQVQAIFDNLNNTSSYFE